MTVASGIEMSTYLAVTELYGRYSHAFDSGQAQACAELFTADATFTTYGRPPIIGRVALQEFFTHAAARSRGMRHFVSNIVLGPLPPDRVIGSAYVLALRVDGDTLRLASLGGYRDEFVCADGIWLIGSRYLTPAIPDVLSGAVVAQAQQ
jgi:hypothetical protein